MRNEAEVKAKINDCESILRELPGADYESLRLYKEVTRGQIRVLKWVLGRKLKPRYLCGKCCKVHINLTCPGCGNSILVWPLSIEREVE